MIEYKNRYGDVFTFELNERGNIDWKGDFGICRFGYEGNPDGIIMIDPSGGPYLVKGYDMGEFSEEFLGMKVKRFVFKDGYYEIVIKKED